MDTMSRPRAKANGMAVAALVLGILSVVLFLAVVISIPCAVAAVGFGIKGRQRTTRAAMATWGLVLGVVGGVLGCFAVVAMFTFLGNATDKQAECDRLEHVVTHSANPGRTRDAHHKLVAMNCPFQP
jgi:protein-S-isoprenylcysteine O-methyltransferase Ste14